MGLQGLCLVKAVPALAAEVETVELGVQLVDKTVKKQFDLASALMHLSSKCLHSLGSLETCPQLFETLSKLLTQ
jgi:hypothetical protein